jgi:hypothetical protein
VVGRSKLGSLDRLQRDLVSPIEGVIEGPMRGPLGDCHRQPKGGGLGVSDVVGDLIDDGEVIGVIVGAHFGPQVNRGQRGRSGICLW